MARSPQSQYEEEHIVFEVGLQLASDWLMITNTVFLLVRLGWNSERTMVRGTLYMCQGEIIIKVFIVYS